MASTYTTANLSPQDLNGAAWALAQVRLMLRDKPNANGAFPAGSLDDDELAALLLDDTLTDTVANGGDGTVYYRPHRTAARIIITNPHFVERWSAAGVSETYRSAEDLARAIREANAGIDDDIATATDGRVGG